MSNIVKSIIQKYHFRKAVNSINNKLNNMNDEDKNQYLDHINRLNNMNDEELQEYLRRKKIMNNKKDEQVKPHKNNMDLLDPHGFWAKFSEFDDDNQKKQEDKE